MPHSPTRPQRSAARDAVLAALLWASVAPLPADAQIPNVRRRAQDAVVRAAGVDTQPPRQCPAVPYDSVIQELTSARLDQLLKGLRARQQVLNGQRGAPSWNAMVSQRDAAVTAAGDLTERKGAEMDAWRQRRDQVIQCRNDEFDKKREARTQANTQRAMSDPDFMRQTVELSQRIMEAQQRGDTAAVNRLAKEARELVEGTATREDTLAVDRHCGRVPSPPASQVQYDSLRALEDSLNARLRRREQEADSATIGASGAKGMTRSQFAMAEERAQMFLAWSASEGAGAQCGFSDAELAALKARRAELDELL